MLSAFHLVASARASANASLPFSAGSSFAGFVRHCAPAAPACVTRAIDTSTSTRRILLRTGASSVGAARRLDVFQLPHDTPGLLQKLHLFERRVQRVRGGGD